ALLNKKITDNDIQYYNKQLNLMGATNTEISFRQNDDNLKSEILSEINKNNNAISEKDITINRLRNELNKYKLSDSTIIKELRILFPSISQLSIGKVEQYEPSDSSFIHGMLLYKTTQAIEESKLKEWLKERLNLAEVTVIKQE